MKDMNYNKVYFIRKCIGVLGEFGEWVMLLLFVMYKKGMGEFLRVEILYGKFRFRVEDIFELFVLYLFKLK